MKKYVYQVSKHPAPSLDIDGVIQTESLIEAKDLAALNDGKYIHELFVDEEDIKVSDEYKINGVSFTEVAIDDIGEHLGTVNFPQLGLVTEERAKSRYIKLESRVGMTEHVYVVAVSSSSLKADIIRWFTHARFSHVGIALDSDFKKYFSFVSAKDNFAIETPTHYDPKDKFSIYSLEVTPKQKRKMIRYANSIFKNKDKARYSIENIFRFALGMVDAVQDKFKQICSQFVANTFKMAGIDLFSIPSNLVSPADFVRHPGFKFVTKGYMKHFYRAMRRVKKFEDAYRVTQALIGEEDYLDETEGEVSEEAAASKNKRKAVLAYLEKHLNVADPSGHNWKLYKEYFAGMSDAQFDKYMNHLKNGDTQLAIFIDNGNHVIKPYNLVKAGEGLGIKMFERVREVKAGVELLTPEEYPILKIPIRRQEQTIKKKISLPSSKIKTNALTGQVTGDARASAISNPEIQVLASRGMDKALTEYLKVRGGDVTALSEFNRQLEETGECTLDEVGADSRAKSADLVNILLSGMGIQTTL